MEFTKGRTIRGCVGVTLVVCVIAEVVASELRLFDKLDLTDSQNTRIATNICYDISSGEDCEENFLGPPEDIGQPAALWIEGVLGSQVYFGLSYSELHQVVVMVPDVGKAIKEQSIFAGTITSREELDPTMNYTFWTAAIFENGTHSPWLQGPRLLAWNDTVLLEKRGYLIDVTEEYEDDSDVLVNMSWNASSSNERIAHSNQTFKIMIYCGGRAYNDKDWIVVRPGENGVYSIRAPEGVTCQFTVTGVHGTSNLIHYVHGPPAEAVDARNISVRASATGAAQWDVRVSWAPPQRAPRGYRVTLQPRAGPGRTEHVLANQTEVTFHGVTGHGAELFYVIVDTLFQLKKLETYRTSIRALFPSVPAELSSVSVTVLSSVLGALLLLTALVGAVTLCRHRRKLKNGSWIDDLEDPGDFPKKLFPEVPCDAPLSEDCWEVRPEKLQLHEVIGEGAFGVVRRGTLAPGKEVAVKMLKDYPSRDEVRSFRSEMELMKSVGAHPHVVSLVGCCSGRRPLIVAEYCSRGDLLSYLRCSWDVMVSKRSVKNYNNNSETSNYRNDLFKNKPQEQSKLVVNKLYDLNGVCDTELTYVDLLSFCRQIAMGMEFLASNRVVHRDLAARNVLVTSDRTLKIADFGLSRDIYQENQYKQKGNGKMPVKWMALESLTHRIYTTQSDVWSFGVVVWEIVSVGATPYPDVPPARLARLLRAGYRMPRPAACTQPLYELMESCWRGRPRERPTFSELHAALDAMLHGACAQQYLALDRDEPRDEPRRHARLIDLARGKLRRGECEPLRTHSNHYSSPPAPSAPLSANSSICA